jgi:hypothetical protein
MTKPRQKQRAAKPTSAEWREFIAANPHFRRPVQRAMAAQMLYSIAMTMLLSKKATDKHKAFTNAVLPHLHPAVVDPFMHIPFERREQVLDVLSRACDHAWLEAAQSHDVPDIADACLLWLEAMEAAGYDLGPRHERLEAARAMFGEDRVQSSAAPAIAADMQFRFEESGLFVGAWDALPDEGEQLAQAAE